MSRYFRVGANEGPFVDEEDSLRPTPIPWSYCRLLNIFAWIVIGTLFTLSLLALLMLLCILGAAFATGKNPDNLSATNIACAVVIWLFIGVCLPLCAMMDMNPGLDR